MVKAKLIRNSKAIENVRMYFKNVKEVTEDETSLQAEIDMAKLRSDEILGVKIAPVTGLKQARQKLGLILSTLRLYIKDCMPKR